MKILHISAECYPAAKAGGLGDVVGALPRYLTEMGSPASVLIPKYHTRWILEQEFVPVYQSSIRLHRELVPFRVEREKTDKLGFGLYVVSMPGKFDRPGVYGDPGGGWYADELERWLSFQQAALQWIVGLQRRPDLIHCHDHHTGLIPFLMKHSPEFRILSLTPSVFTIHNGAYHGAFGWSEAHLLPFCDQGSQGILDWNHSINPLASAVKTAWQITTVSPSYLQELMESSNGLEPLIRNEFAKARGVLNGIDAEVWDPRTDEFIARQMKKSVNAYKEANKKALQEHFQFNPKLPVVTFIGRLVREKGADLLPSLYRRLMEANEEVAFLVLGSGEHYIQDAFRDMKRQYPERFDAAIEYNESLAHQLYAGSDFLIMPSRVEPCGLNQMYAMRYGTVPIVRSVGGLRDTVPDVGEPDGSGRGIRFDNFTLDDAELAIRRAISLYNRKKAFHSLREKIMDIDFSWENSAQNYLNIYEKLF